MDHVQEVEPHERGTKPSASGDVSLSLLGGFELRAHGTVVPLPLNPQRVLGFLALQSRPLLRCHVAAMLWPSTTDRQASANLRSALWRLRRSCPSAVEVTGQHLAKGKLAIDVLQTIAWADRVIHADASEPPGPDHRPPNLRGELLPDWYDDWLFAARERLRQLRLHALELVCARLAEAGLFAQAVEAGLAAVALEPLRESAHRAVIYAYLSEANPSEAVRHYRSFCQLLDDNIGWEPSPALQSLMREVEARMTLR